MTGVASPLTAGLMGVWLRGNLRGDADRLPAAPWPADAARAAGWTPLHATPDVCVALTEDNGIALVALAAGGHHTAVFLTDGPIDSLYAMNARAGVREAAGG